MRRDVISWLQHAPPPSPFVHAFEAVRATYPETRAPITPSRPLHANEARFELTQSHPAPSRAPLWMGTGGGGEELDVDASFAADLEISEGGGGGSGGKGAPTIDSEEEKSYLADRLGLSFSSSAAPSLEGSSASPHVSVPPRGHTYQPQAYPPQAYPPSSAYQPPLRAASPYSSNSSSTSILAPQQDVSPTAPLQSFWDADSSLGAPVRVKKVEISVRG